MLPNCYWIVADHHAWPWDQAWYGEVSVDLWFRLTQRLLEWWGSMMSAFGVKAPGVAWVGQFFVPLGQALGSIELGLLCSIVVTQLGSLVLFYKVVEEFASGRRLVVAVGILLFASAPLFVGMSHQLFAEPLQLFGVTYFYFLAVRGHRMRRILLLGNLLIATAIGLSAKSTSPIYCILPGLIAARALFLKRASTDSASPTEELMGWRCLFAGLVLCWMCAVFYFSHFQDLRGYVKIAMDLEFTADYGDRGTFFQKLPFWFHALQSSFQLPWVIVGQIIAFGVWVGIRKTRPEREGAARSDPGAPLNLLAIASVIHILTVISLCSLNYSEETRYLLPLLPAVATVNLWLISRIRQPWLLTGLVVLLCSQWIAVWLQALGWAHFDKRICSRWVTPVDKSGKWARELARIVRHTAPSGAIARYNIVGLELPWLNANTLSFFAAKEELTSGARNGYTGLGYRPKDLDLAWKRMSDLKSDYFISLDEANQPTDPNFLNLIAAPALRRIRDDPDFISEPFTSDLGVVLFRRKVEDLPATSETTAH